MSETVDFPYTLPMSPGFQKCEARYKVYRKFEKPDCMYTRPQMPGFLK